MKTTSKTTRPRTFPARRGFSLFETQVALILFGIAIAGLGPLTVMQSRHIQQLESQLSDRNVYYYTSSPNHWSRKLGAVSPLTTQDPGPPPVAVTLIDNRDPGYSETDVGYPDWQTYRDKQAYAKKQYRRNNGGWIGDSATWTFPGLEAGHYDVYVTYPPDSVHATDAPFHVFDGPLRKNTVRVDQTTSPDGPSFDKQPWDRLGDFVISSGTLRVVLTDDADGHIAADAVRIERRPVSNIVNVLALHKSLTADGVRVDVSVTPSGSGL